MNQGRFIAIGVLAAAVLGVAAWRAVGAKDAVATERRTLAGQRAKLVDRLERSETELAAAKKTGTETAVAMRAEPPAKPEAVAVGKAAGSKAANSTLEFHEDPKVQVLFFAQERANLAQSYGPFFRAQGLTPTQVERLCDWIIRSRTDSHDLSEIHRLQEKSFNVPEMVAQRDRNKAEVEAGMIEVLGTAGYAALQDYRRSIDVRMYVGKVAGVAAVEGVPISREQADALVQILASATPLFALGGNAEFKSIDWKSAESQAQGIFTAAQMKLLRSDTAGVGPSRRSNAAFDAILRAAREVSAKGGLPAGK
ncbi:MAG: hypothetical protein ABIR80_20560 [Opitutaceae bacterium]